MKKKETKFKETEIGTIPEDWEVVELGEIGKISMCKRIFKNETAPSGDIPFYKIKTFGKEPDAFISKEIFDKYKEKYSYPKEGDILLSTSGTIGRTMVFDGNPAYFQDSNIVWLEHKGDKLDNRFLLYCYKRINWITEGSTIKRLYNSNLKITKIPLPKLKEQKAIAKILSDLDYKSKVNQNINKTLEYIGKTLFKRWFIDFEFPNEKGQPYKSSGGVMVDSEIGQIPEGWEVEKLGNVLTTILGGTPSRTNKDYWKGGDIAWINSGKVNEFRIIKPTEYITEFGLKKSATKLLPKGTTVIAITGATLGQISRLEIDSCANQSVIGILENKQLSSEYIYFWMHKIIDELLRHQTGGAQQHINKNNVDSTNILIPNKELLGKFNSLMKSLFKKVSISCFQNQNLLDLRDLFLPKLMTGKIRVEV